MAGCLAEYDQEALRSVLDGWGKADAEPVPECRPAGSPERCAGRMVVRDADGGLLLLELLFRGQAARRRWIAEIMEGLAGNGMKSIPQVMRTTEGGLLQDHDGEVFQLSRFFPGDALPRPAYVDDGARGANLAAFLAALSRCSKGIGCLPPEPDPVPDLDAYIRQIMARVECREPGLHGTLQRVLNSLAAMESREGSTGLVGFCHGDFHPLNVIWQGQEVRAVIDWEFAGLRNGTYDMANLLGCVGIETPQALVGRLALAFVSGVGRAGLLWPQHLEDLLRITVLLRFGWMSEWLRRRDRDMVDLELRYMNVLLDNRTTLLRAWRDHV